MVTFKSIEETVKVAIKDLGFKKLEANCWPEVLTQDFKISMGFTFTIPRFKGGTSAYSEVAEAFKEFRDEVINSNFCDHMRKEIKDLEDRNEKLQKEIEGLEQYKTNYDLNYTMKHGKEG